MVPLQLDTTIPVIAPLLEAFPNILYSEAQNRSQRPLLNRSDVKNFPSLRCQLHLQPKRSHSVLGMGSLVRVGPESGHYWSKNCCTQQSEQRDDLCAETDYITAPVCFRIHLQDFDNNAHASTDGT